MKVMSFENFKKLFKDSDRERILKDFYYNYQLLVELKEYRRIIKEMTNDTYIEPNSKEKRFIDKVIELGTGEIIEDTPKEDKKIEKLDRGETIYKDAGNWGAIIKTKEWTDNELEILDKLDEIIDKVNGDSNE